MATNPRRARGHDRIAAAKLAREQAERRRQRRPWIIGGAALAAVVVVAVGLLVKSSSDSSNVTTGPTPTTGVTGTTVAGAPVGFTYGTGPCAPTTPPASPTLDFSGTNGFQKCIDPIGHYTATFATTAGEIKVDLDTTVTPGTTNNFVQLAGFGYYNNTQLFRTDTSIGIIQGGAAKTNSPSDPGPGFTIPDEGAHFTYKPGQLVMARTSSPNSASSQFFFTVDDKASQLDAQGTYVSFGTVISGLDVLQKILASNVPGTGGLGGAPSPAVTVNSVTIGRASLVPGG
jgi:peptidyl-prolyl cis-trans isomerase A (cyclophilin A)